MADSVGIKFCPPPQLVWDCTLINLGWDSDLSIDNAYYLVSFKDKQTSEHSLVVRAVACFRKDMMHSV